MIKANNLHIRDYLIRETATNNSGMDNTEKNVCNENEITNWMLECLNTLGDSENQRSCNTNETEIPGIRKTQ